MTAANIRAELRRFIDEGDEALLRMMLVVAKEYTPISNEYDFTDEQLKEFEVRRAKRISGESKGRPVFGCAKGLLTMREDFDEPLEDFKDYM